MQGFPGIKSKYQTTKKDDYVRGKVPRAKTQTAEPDDSLDMGRTSQQVYFEDEAKAEGSRDALALQARSEARRMKILKTPADRTGRQSAESQPSMVEYETATTS